MSEQLDKLKSMRPFVISKDDPFVIVDEEDFSWMVEQAERAEELEEENKRLNYEIGSYSGDIHEKARIVIQESIELQEMAKKMLKGESE